MSGCAWGAGLDAPAGRKQAAEGTRFQFHLATAADGPELRAFGCGLDAPGLIRFAFDRGPDYFAALRVEGRQSEVLVCRDGRSGRVVATGHRSVKPMFINGEATQGSYLGGLHVAGTVRGGPVLARGYAVLRELHARQPAPFYLTTIMEDNQQAKRVLTSGRCGLPRYHDLGRYCCMAFGLRSGRNDGRSGRVCVRQATAADAPVIVAFLQREGRLRQFFPAYQTADFGSGGGLLSHLEWEDLLLAWCGNELIGAVAAWDQRAFRQWRVTGYAPWLRLLRRPFNLLARLKHLPDLPKPGAALNCFVLSLICIRNSERAVFAALLEEIIRKNWNRYGFFLAGLHERDPLLPELAARPHFPLPSRLYAVAWEDGAESVRRLDLGLVPYLELGSL
jgi:hypothetical protein